MGGKDRSELLRRDCFGMGSLAAHGWKFGKSGTRQHGSRVLPRSGVDRFGAAATTLSFDSPAASHLDEIPLRISTHTRTHPSRVTLERLFLTRAPRLLLLVTLLRSRVKLNSSKCRHLTAASKSLAKVHLPIYTP